MNAGLDICLAAALIHHERAALAIIGRVETVLPAIAAEVNAIENP